MFDFADENAEGDHAEGDHPKENGETKPVEETTEDQPEPTDTKTGEDEVAAPVEESNTVEVAG